MLLNRSTLRSILRVATDVFPKLPSSGDSLFTIAVKLLAIADSATKLSSKGSSAALIEFFEGLDARSESNETFVDLFFGTELQKAFTVDRVPMASTNAEPVGKPVKRVIAGSVPKAG